MLDIKRKKYLYDDFRDKNDKFLEELHVTCTQPVLIKPTFAIYLERTIFEIVFLSRKPQDDVINQVHGKPIGATLSQK